MRIKLNSAIACVASAVLVLGLTGCTEATCARACGIGGVSVLLEPAIAEGGYDVELVLDGLDGSFTCEGGFRTSDQTGSGQLVVSCSSDSFSIGAAPETVEISVTAQVGSWMGSVREDLVYAREPRCPGEEELCPPFAMVTVTEGATVSEP